MNICIRFDKDTFHHLCGINKLTDMEVARREKRESVFDKIVNGIYSEKLFQKSSQYAGISGRIDCLERLESILDDKDTVFKFNSSANKGSKIEADYIIENEFHGLRYYFWVFQKNDDGIFFGRSCFTRTQHERDFTIGHTSYTVLRKVKIDLRTQTETELFVLDSYKRELERQDETNAENASAVNAECSGTAFSGTEPAAVFADSVQEDEPQAQPYIPAS